MVIQIIIKLLEDGFNHLFLIGNNFLFPLIMYRYQINSKRKHFYSCQLCSFVFIKSEAVRNHYKNRHPDQTCFTEEYNSG